jgi:hypothetical protein
VRATGLFPGALAKLGDTYMLTRKTPDSYIPVILKRYNTRRYLQTKDALALLEKSPDKNGTLFVQGTPARSKSIKPGLHKCSTDHLSFDAVGIPGFQFVQDPLNYETLTHHSNMDVFDRSNDR